ncbi:MULTISPECIES: c-type cytochrome [Silvimonas]|uniref:c-type cytochrome n=1 Tax=Silvimonas TaxID=300264 RepID=UPI0024B3C799|nr:MULTISPECIES: c-type cytochrome [Silvimonas]MDR3429261.1 c-type cytochrome [Silvimonas sp.]
MLIRSALVSLVLFALATPALAVDPQDLAKSKNCFACHALDSKLVGPAWKDVAAKFKTQKGAADMLAGKIKNGSQGTWGAVPMPPNAVSDAEAKQLAQWILTRKY